MNLIKKLNLDRGEKLKISLFFRIEPAFGSGTPIAVNIGTGHKYNLF